MRVDVAYGDVRCSVIGGHDNSQHIVLNNGYGDRLLSTAVNCYMEAMHLLSSAAVGGLLDVAQVRGNCVIRLYASVHSWVAEVAVRSYLDV